MNNTNENEEMKHWAKHYDIAFNRGFFLGSLIGFGAAVIMVLISIYLL